MKRISAVFTLVILVLMSCQPAGGNLAGGSGGETPLVSEAFYSVAASIFETIGLLFESEEPTSGDYPDGMVCSWVSENVSLIISLTDCQPLVSNTIVLDGSVTITRNDDIEAGESTLLFNGTMTTDSGDSVVMAGSATFPLVGGEPDTGKDPISTTGSLSCADEEHSIDDVFAVIYSEDDDDDTPTVANIRFITVGNSEILVTDDGTNWEIVLVDGLAVSLWDVSCNSTGHYVAAGNNGKIIYSPDGRTWTAATLPAGISATVKCVQAIGSQFYAGLEEASNVLVSEDNGVSWSTQALTGIAGIYDFAYDGSKLIAVGAGRTCFKTGINSTELNASFWTNLVDSDSEVNIQALWLRSIEFSGGHWVAVGQSGSDAPEIRSVIRSDDGSDWDMEIPAGDGFMTSVSGNGDGEFIYSYHDGDEYAWESPGYINFSDDNGETWSAVSSDSELATIVSSAHGPMGNGTSLWMAVSTTGDAYFSSDGTNWTEKSSEHGTHGLSYVPIVSP